MTQTKYIALCIEGLHSDGYQFHQYHQNEQSPSTFNHRKVIDTETNTQIDDN